MILQKKISRFHVIPLCLHLLAASFVHGTPEVGDSSGLSESEFSQKIEQTQQETSFPPEEELSVHETEGNQFFSNAQESPESEPQENDGIESVAEYSNNQEKTLRQELDIPLVPHPHVQKYIQEYQKPYTVKWLTSVLESAAPYRIYIRQQLQEHGLPACLEYLPVIESEYKPTAKSRSGALGVWQFMENSIEPFLEKNEWIDERLDPWKSTDAAIQKLLDNYRMFNNWELALAAYNFGAGGLSRLIKRNDNTSDYWKLVDKGVLTNQTEMYVPKFLAVAEVITNEDYYGLEFPKVTDDDMLTWDEITVTKSVSLTALAEEMNIDASILQFLNQSLIKGRTPPATEYTLRVPAGTAQEALALIEHMRLPNYEHIYTVVKGDTLWGISRRYGITVAELCEANNITENGILSIGKTLYVPIID